ncbi:MAG: hypothetical protein AB7D36_11350, partial [Oscillospiraceae bacterium]
MNFFEKELRNILDSNYYTADVKVVGRAYYASIGKNLRLKAEFVTMGTADHYEGIKATVINRNDGPVDSLTLRFADVLGGKTTSKVSNDNLPYAWTYNEKTEWYTYEPTPRDYEILSDALNDYIEVFC